MTIVIVLAMSDFTKPFVVEINALWIGLEAILMQKGRLIAYISRALSSHNHLNLVYEIE